jgi:hypothetical protein
MKPVPCPLTRRFAKPALFFAVIAAPSFCPAAIPPAPPNVLILITDDQGYGKLSVHGNPVLKTPHLDRLHAESIRLAVRPVCAGFGVAGPAFGGSPVAC